MTKYGRRQVVKMGVGALAGVAAATLSTESSRAEAAIPPGRGRINFNRGYRVLVPDGRQVAAAAATQTLSPGETASFDRTSGTIIAPLLWRTDSPYLHGNMAGRFGFMGLVDYFRCPSAASTGIAMRWRRFRRLSGRKTEFQRPPVTETTATPRLCGTLPTTRRMRGGRWTWSDLWPSLESRSSSRAAKSYRYRIETSRDGQTRKLAVDQTATAGTAVSRTDLFPSGIVGRFLPVTFTSLPQGTVAAVREVKVYGSEVAG